MRHVRETIEIGVPPSRGWDLIARFEHWPHWGVSIDGVEAAGSEVESGLKGRVKTAVGPWLPFEITDVDPGRSWSWRVAGIPATGHVVEAIGADRCAVSFTVPWPAAPYRFVLRRSLRRLAAMA